MVDARTRAGWRWGILVCLCVAGLDPASVAGQVPMRTAAGGDETSPERPVEVDFSFLSDPVHGVPSWIVAKVNDEIVTRHEVLEKIKNQLVALRASYEGDPYRRKAREMWDKTVADLVEERVLLQAARKEGVEVTWKDVDRSMDDEIKRAGSREKFDQNLAQTGQTLDQFRENLRKQLMMRDLIYRGVGVREPKNPKTGSLAEDPIATPGEIHAYYEAHKQDFFVEEKIKVRQIILRFRDEAQRLQMLDIARSILRQVEAGADLRALARWYTAVRAEEDGLWDWAPRGSLPAEIEEQIFALKPGETSPILESGSTIRIVRMETRQDSRQPAFSEVQEEIKRRIQNKRIYERIDKFKRDLFRDYYIWPPDVIRPGK